MSFTEIFRFLPGFRFRPTDEELVSYYLRKKVCGRGLPFEVIAEVDLYMYEPWDLPEKSALPSGDLEWYFFIPRDRKYPNGSRTNRATAKGFWKSTGKDRSVSSNSRAMGTKKTLVYYNGRAPKGERTNWVMHEYRLNDLECQRIHAAENGFVLCRVYEKSGPGPKNGEQYGAPVKDGDFEDSPTVEADGSGSIKLGPFESGPSSTSGNYGSFTSGGETGAVSYEIDLVNGEIPCPGFEPRNPNAHLEQLFGDFQEDSIQNMTPSANRGFVFDANGGLVDSPIVAPITCEEEAEMLEELLGVCADQLESVDGYQDVHASVDSGCYQPGAHPPNDGDFLELDDLASSDGEEGNDFMKDIAKNVSMVSRDHLVDSQFPLQALPTFDRSGQWQNLPFGDGVYEAPRMTPEVRQMQSSLSTVTYDPHHQPSINSMLECCPLPSAVYNEELGSVGHKVSGESENESVLKFFDHLNACASEQGLAENLLRGLFESEDNLAVPLQDGHYFDAVPSFTNGDVCGECTDAILQASYDNGIPQATLAQASLSNKVNEALDKPEHPDQVLEAEDLVPDGNALLQGEAICLEQGRHSPHSLSLFLRWMDSLPTLPASAAELSPKATSSVRVTATSVGVGAVSVTCKCTGEGVPSSCMNCSVAEVEKKGRFVKSLSFVGQRKESSDGWGVGFSKSAVFGGLLAVVVAVLIAAGAWKSWGGVYKLVMASQT